MWMKRALHNVRFRHFSRCWRSFASTPSNNNNNVPIIIVGAGPSGLFLSRLLDSYGTPSIVLEASPAPTTHPQAHFINTRSMEIMRHLLPDIYTTIQSKMPPVDEWKTFRFGHDVYNCMAQVIHPVDRPLQQNVDANGKLVMKDDDNVDIFHESTDDETPLSACSVGHLAQHTFCHVLNEANAPLATIHYDMPVVNVDFVNGLHHVITKNGETFVSPVVVAADGSRSTLRQLWNLDNMDGQPAIQHLVNVHVRVNPEQLVQGPPPPAMLYSIWNASLVGMMVRHSATEYVLQIPYFPPYQTMERNFTFEKVQDMVEAAFGGGSQDGFFIESIRPWAMSSLVAQNYYSKHANGVLVGDAAHVFPPAGGFGMNTGLQDAHNLAWRLSLWHSKHNSSCEQLPLLFSQYESERRPVAQRNAALSVRNYKRVLELSKACYLNEQHPAILLNVLDSMSSFLPLAARQTTFQSLVHAAMFPLNALSNPSHPHAQLMTTNVRTILKQGGGLPLLFPLFELGFGYDSGDECKDDSTMHDSMGYSPQLRQGYLLPHVELQVLDYCEERHGNLQFIDNQDSTRGVRITSSDLPCQLRVDGPCFALILLNGSDETVEVVGNALDVVKEEASYVHVASVQVIGPSCQSGTSASSSFDLVVQDGSSTLSRIACTDDPLLILVRPDGHVARTLTIHDQQEAAAIGKTLTEAIDQ